MKPLWYHVLADRRTLMGLLPRIGSSKRRNADDLHGRFADQNANKISRLFI